jgi:glycerol-3-phosphate dehydrogenase
MDGPGGLLTITGGKLTTYRRMAEDVVDRVVARDGRRARCRTEHISLGCARSLRAVQADTVEAANALRLGEETAKLLVRQHGEAAADVLSLVAARPELGRVLSPEAPHLMAEVAYAVQAEGAVTLDDVFSRRMRLALRVRDAGLSVAPDAAALMAELLERPDGWTGQQVATYARGVARERGPVAPLDTVAAQPTEV